MIKNINKVGWLENAPLEGWRYTVKTVMPEDGEVYFWIMSHDPKSDEPIYYHHSSTLFIPEDPKTHEDRIRNIVNYLNKRLDRADEYDRMIDRMVERHEEQEEYELMIKYGSER